MNDTTKLAAMMCISTMVVVFLLVTNAQSKPLGIKCVDVCSSSLRNNDRKMFIECVSICVGAGTKDMKGNSDEPK